MMSLFTIDHTKCIRDGLCAADCPMGIITMNGHGPEPVEGAEQMCINCGHCAVVCPHGALALQTMPLDQCPPLQPGWQLTPQQAEQYLKGRRSVRRYKPEPVPREVLGKIIDIARFAPTAGNAQALHWTVIHNSKEVQHIAGATIDWLREASQTPDMAWATALISAWDSGHDLICRSAPHLILTHVPTQQADMAAADGAIALTYVELAAQSHQVGTCWAGLLMMAEARSAAVHATLKLPKDHQFLGGMMIGYPNMKVHRIPVRNAPQLTWH